MKATTIIVLWAVSYLQGFGAGVMLVAGFRWVALALFVNGGFVFVVSMLLLDENHFKVR